MHWGMYECFAQYKEKNILKMERGGNMGNMLG